MTAAVALMRLRKPPFMQATKTNCRFNQIKIVFLLFCYLYLLLFNFIHLFNLGFSLHRANAPPSLVAKFH